MSRWYEPSSRWVVSRVENNREARWPDNGFMRVGSDKLIVCRAGLRDRLLSKCTATESASLQGLICSHLENVRDIAHAGAVDRGFSAASVDAMRAACAKRYARGLKPTASCVELVSPKSVEVLPALCAKLDALAEAVRPAGGAVHAFVVNGPVLHIGQAKDLSCAYRSAQMIISHMLRRDERAWPGANECFIDVAEVRGNSIAVPSVKRLQRAVERAWQEGYDPVGAAQLDYLTAHPERLQMTCDGCKLDFFVPRNDPRVGGGVAGFVAACPRCVKAVKMAASQAAAAVSAASIRGGGSTSPTTGAPKGRIVEYAGRPEHQPNLKLMGASDMWALMRWTGAKAELHDFIDGPGNEKTSSELLFEWVWDHLCRSAETTEGDGVRRCKCGPVYLQWAGHAVVIVGAVRRQLHKQQPPERHLLIFNPETWTEVLYDALRAPEPSEAPDPEARWWKIVAWNAKKVGVRRVTIEEAVACPTSELKGPGGENGPYQTMYVPAGWVTSARERQYARSPEDACTQHVGDNVPQRLPRKW